MATYEWIIRNGANSSTRISAPSTESTGKKTESVPSFMKPATVYGIAKRAVTMGINHRVNTVELRTGHAELQQRQQMINDIATRSFNFVESIAAGFLVSGGNPVGAAIGAVTSLAFQGIQISQQLEERQWRMQEESIGISLANVRAGLGRQAR